MKKSILAVGAATLALALFAAPAAAVADEVIAPETPVTEEVQVVETPAEEVVVEETPDAEETVVEEVVSEERTVAVAEAPDEVKVAEETKTIRWILPAPGTPENVTWPQPIASDANLALVPCGETRSIQVDVYPYTSDADKARTDGLGDTLEYGEDHGWVKSWSFETYTAPACITNACETGVSTHSTNLVPLWGNVDTRSAGHYEYVEDGLRVWTDDNSSQAKVSLGQAISFPLHDTGVLDLAWSGSTPPPGINLFVNFGADGNGTLVYESVYGQDLWLTNGSSAAVKANAPVNGGGNGSQYHGTIDQWLTKYPNAQVTGIAFSLGSGVKGDGVISSITVGCGVHTFDYVEPAAEPEALVETRTESVTDCEAGTATTTEYTRTTGPATFDSATNTWTRGEFGEWVAGEPVVTEATAEECPVVVPPTEEPPTTTPEETPAPVATTTAVGLAQTGGPNALPWALGGAAAVLAGLSMALFRRFRLGRQ